MARAKTSNRKPVPEARDAWFARAADALN
jgi:hypothetical protein